MMLRDHLDASGRLLFRRRGWLPLLILLVAPTAFFRYSYPWQRHDLQEAWTFLCIGVALLGQVVRFLTIGQVPSRTSGRNRKEQVADSLNTDGMYSIVRNPLYLGNCLTWLGLAAVPHSVWLWVSVALVFWIYHERVIMAEESFLEGKFGSVFREWASRTPAFVPSFSRWKRAPLSFSFKTAIGREYVNWFALVSAFTAFDAAADSAAERHWHVDREWAIAWVIALVFFVAIRLLKKRTHVFRVAGRDW